MSRLLHIDSGRYTGDMSTSTPEPAGQVTPAQIASILSQQPNTANPSAPAGQEPTSPSTGQEPTAPAGAQDPQTVESLPDWAQKLIRDTRREAAGYRTSRDEAATAARNEAIQRVAQAFGIDEEKTPQLDELTAQLTKAQTDARIADVTNRAIRAASAKGGIDVDGMLDSVMVTTKLAGLDPTAATFETDLASIIADAATRYPVRSASTASTTGPPVTGQPQTGQLTLDDVKGMSPDEIATAVKEGRLKGLL